MCRALKFCWGRQNMSSKGSASDAKTDASRALRVGVVGAGVMGSNHARVLAGLPDVTLVGIVDPLPEHRARAIAMVGCRAFAEPRRAVRRRRRRHHHRGADPSASRDCARLHHAQHPHPGREAGRLDGGGGAGHRQRGAQRRRDADGRPCRALQSGGRRDQAGDLGRGYSFDRHHPRRAVSAADVQCRRRDRSGRARYRPDPLVHRIRYHRGAAAAFQRDRRARGYRAACSSAPPRACSPTSTPTG